MVSKDKQDSLPYSKNDQSVAFAQFIFTSGIKAIVDFKEMFFAAAWCETTQAKLPPADKPMTEMLEESIPNCVEC